MDVSIDILRIVHVITAVLMAWPFYALVTVNQRARLGPPVGDRVDLYMENIIRNRTIPCLVFEITVLVTGIALVVMQGFGLAALITMPILAAKLVLLVLIAGLLGHVHFNLQPGIDAIFSESQDQPLPPDQASKVSGLRLRRKRLATVCLFSVLTMTMLGVQVWREPSLWFLALMVAAIALFTWRAYKSVTPLGWA
jgi:hypothetical protein